MAESTVLWAGEIHVHYGFLNLAAAGVEPPQANRALAGQTNGICGAAVFGGVWFTTGLHTGAVPVTVTWSPDEPPVGEEWEDVVEVAFTVTDPALRLSAFDTGADLRVPEIGPHRLRYSAHGMEAGRALDTAHEVAAPDRYLIELWPVTPDRIVRQTSEIAAYWHGVARETPRWVAPPPPPPRPPRAGGARQVMADLRRAELPEDRLRLLGGNVLGVHRSDPVLLRRIAALDEDGQRRLAAWLARRAAELTGLATADWVTPTLDALDRGDQAPEPFTSHRAALDRLTVHRRKDPERPRQATVTVASAKAGRPVPPPDFRPSLALPVIVSAGHADALRAAVDAFSHLAHMYGTRRGELVDEVEARLPPA